MFSTLPAQAPDKIIALIAEYAADTRPGKLDLGVGVYKDRAGRTPVMQAVKMAEKRLLETEETKTYKALLGDGGFIDGMIALVLGADAPAQVCAAQAPGGTGALHTLFELVRLAEPDATFWVSDPTWANHVAMLRHLGLPVKTYRYFDAATRDVDFAAMVEDLSAAGPKDVILLHGCCHNPTGANLTAENWAELTRMALAQGFLPLVDFAYQGFGDGLEADAAGVRAMASAVPQILIAASCSKNFGLYRDRVGIAIAKCATDAVTATTRDTLAAINRVNYSFPPDHGAVLVGQILADPALRGFWTEELEAMRLRMLTLREGLAEALRRETNSDRFDFLARHRGMFSRLGATPEQVARLKQEHGVYMVGDSRMNIAGLREDGLDAFARAIVAAGV